MMETMNYLADPHLVARIQQFFGVEHIKPGTSDQQTQTKRPSLSMNASSSNNNASCNNGKSSLIITQTHQCDHIPELSSEKCRVCYHDNSESNRKHDTSSSARHRGSKHSDVEHNNNGYCMSHKGRDNDDETPSLTNGINGHHRSSINHCDAKTKTQEHNGVSITSVVDKNGSLSSVSGSEKSGISEPEQHAFRIKYKSLFYLAHFGAFLGNEHFYLTFFPFVMWNLDSLMVRQVSLLWAFVMYLGQGTKDYLKWPRPPCPPVVRLETSYLQEFAMPSTHAMAGTAIPMYLAYLAIVRYEVSVPVAVTIAICWYTVTCYSRLYLGVHSVLDIIVGTVYAVILFFTFIRYVENYDLYQQTHLFAPIMIVITALILCTFVYPNTNKNSAKGDAVQIVSAIAGLCLGSWLLYQYGYTHKPQVLSPYVIEAPTLKWVTLSLLRFISGLIVLGVSYLTLKYITVRGFSYLYGLDVPDKNNPNVMTAYKFTSYFALGFLITYAVPIIHTWLSIERPSYFHEVL